MALQKLTYAPSPPNSLTKPVNGKLRQAFSDRLMLSEAIDAVGQMIRGYANRGTADKSYIGAIASLLCQYPRTLALDCADPLHGVVLTTKFMPTPADIAGWMEPRVERMAGRVDAEERAERQLRERREYDAQQPDDLSEVPKFSRYNLIVRVGRPGYEQMVERSKHSAAGEFSWTSDGILVPIDWYHERHSWRPQP